jgi:hypothetical protein
MPRSGRAMDCKQNAMDNLALVKVILLVLNPILVSLTLYVVAIKLF